MNLDIQPEKVMHSLRRLIDQIEDVAPGLTLEQLACLAIIADHEGLSVQELADLRQAPQSTVSRQLKKLCKPYRQEFKKSMGPLRFDAEIVGYGFGLVEQKINPNEPKKRALYLTARAKSLLDAIDPLA